MKKQILSILTLLALPIGSLCGCGSSIKVNLDNEVKLTIQGPRKIQCNSSAVYTVQSSAKTNEEYNWKIHKTTVATISSSEGNACTIDAHSVGRTYITVSIPNTDIFCTYEIEITNLAPTSITISGETDLFVDLNSQPYSITYEPEESEIGVNWSIVEGDNLASIDDAGIVTPYFEGKIKIKATSKLDTSVYDVFDVNIHPKKPEKISIVGPDVVSATIGPTQYTVTFSPETSSDDVLWSLGAGEEQYATMSSDGILTPLSVGTIHITAQAKFKPEVTNTLEVKIVSTIYNVSFNETIGIGYTYDCPSFATPSIDLIIPFSSKMYDNGGFNMPTHKQLKASDLQIKCNHGGSVETINNYTLKDNILVIPKDEIQGDITITILGAEISDSITWETLSSISQNDIDHDEKKSMEMFQVGDYKKTRRNNVTYGYTRLIDFFHDFYYDDEGKEHYIPFTFLTLDDGGDYSYCKNRMSINDTAKWRKDEPLYQGVRYETMLYALDPDYQFDTLNYVRKPVKYIQQVGQHSETVEDLEKDVVEDVDLYYFPLDYKELNGAKAHGDDPGFDKTEETMMKIKGWKSQPYSYFLPDKYIADLSILDRRIFNTVHHKHDDEEDPHYFDCAWVRNGDSWLSFCWIDLDNGQIINEDIGHGSLMVLNYATIFFAFCI